MKMEEKNSQLLTPSEVCTLLGGISLKTLADWNNRHRHKKLLSPIRFSNKHVRYEYKNVIAFKEKCRAIY